MGPDSPGTPCLCFLDFLSFFVTFWLMNLWTLSPAFGSLSAVVMDFNINELWRRGSDSSHCSPDKGGTVSSSDGRAVLTLVGINPAGSIATLRLIDLLIQVRIRPTQRFFLHADPSLSPVDGAHLSAYRAYQFHREEKVTLCRKKKFASPQVFLLYFKTTSRLLELEGMSEWTGLNWF